MKVRKTKSTVDAKEVFKLAEQGYKWSIYDTISVGIKEDKEEEPIKKCFGYVQTDNGWKECPLKDTCVRALKAKESIDGIYLDPAPYNFVSSKCDKYINIED